MSHLLTLVFFQGVSRCFCDDNWFGTDCSISQSDKWCGPGTKFRVATQKCVANNIQSGSTNLVLVLLCTLLSAFLYCLSLVWRKLQRLKVYSPISLNSASGVDLDDEEEGVGARYPDKRMNTSGRSSSSQQNVVTLGGILELSDLGAVAVDADADGGVEGAL